MHSACVWRVSACEECDVWCVTRTLEDRGLRQDEVGDYRVFRVGYKKISNPVSERAAWRRKGQSWVKATTNLFVVYPAVPLLRKQTMSLFYFCRHLNEMFYQNHSLEN